MIEPFALKSTGAHLRLAVGEAQDLLTGSWNKANIKYEQEPNKFIGHTVQSSACPVSIPCNCGCGHDYCSYCGFKMAELKKPIEYESQKYFQACPNCRPELFNTGVHATERGHVKLYRLAENATGYTVAKCMPDYAAPIAGLKESPAARPDPPFSPQTPGPDLTPVPDLRRRRYQCPRGHTMWTYRLAPLCPMEGCQAKMQEVVK